MVVPGQIKELCVGVWEGRSECVCVGCVVKEVGIYMCVWVCVWERGGEMERERERERVCVFLHAHHTEWFCFQKKIVDKGKQTYILVCI